ncbi:MAG: YjgB family protein [Bacillota bacterium]|nr:YjgB family protein [Bacillota bacterium]
MILTLKKATLKWVLVMIALLLAAGCSNQSSPTSSSHNQKNSTTSDQQNTNPNTSSSTSPDASKSVVYENTQYGFSFKLPASWKGYSIVTSQWDGIGLADGSVVETGPIISIRDPKWTAKTPRQDIPIMVFTLNQWNILKQGVFHIGAAPLDPSELGRNNYYVFALPARYNYSFPAGYKEVETILSNHPLQTTKATKLQLGSTETLLAKMMSMAKQGKIISSDFAVKTTNIDEVEKAWGKADKTDLVTAAKGQYSTYSKYNVVFGFNKGGQIFEARSNSNQLKGITLAAAKEVLGTPAYDAKVNGQEVIGYLASSAFKLELVFPQPTNSKPNPVIDHYNVFYPKGTVNSMANDPGRQW